MDSSTKSTKKHCFVEEDDGLASIADMEAGFSGNHHYPLVSRPLYYTAMPSRGNLRNISSALVSSPRSARNFYEPQQPHFLDACFLCKTPLGSNSDIFMYRGDTPFCSEECREEQIEMDEAKEKSLNLSASMRALRKKDQRKSSKKTSQDCTFRTSTVAAA